METGTTSFELARSFNGQISTSSKLKRLIGQAEDRRPDPVELRYATKIRPAAIRDGFLVSSRAYHGYGFSSKGRRPIDAMCGVVEQSPKFECSTVDQLMIQCISRCMATPVTMHSFQGGMITMRS